MMKALLKKFADDEFGNAVIDWTVLMAGTVMMAMAVVFTITNNVDSITDDTNERIEMVGSDMANS